MGTRDDEYDYLFKGTAGEAQTGEGAAARRWTDGLKQRSRPLGPGRCLGLGARRVRPLGRPGQARLCQLWAGVYDRAEWVAKRGLKALHEPRRGWSPEGGGSRSGGTGR